MRPKGPRLQPCACRLKPPRGTRTSSHTSPLRGRVGRAAVRSPYGTRPECGTRGISHPRNARVPEGAPPTIRCAAGVPVGRWGRVAYAWRASHRPCLAFLSASRPRCNHLLCNRSLRNGIPSQRQNRITGHRSWLRLRPACAVPASRMPVRLASPRPMYPRLAPLPPLKAVLRFSQPFLKRADLL